MQSVGSLEVDSIHTAPTALCTQLQKDTLRRSKALSAMVPRDAGPEFANVNSVTRREDFLDLV